MQSAISPATKIKSMLIALRNKRNISQTEFAKIMGMRQPNLAKFESRDDAKFSTIIKYAKALGLKSIKLD
jgi:DNA polymerase III delta prime subunit